MKQNITKHIISLSLLLSVFASQMGLVLAQNSPDDAFNSGGQSLYPLPFNAVIGSTAERENAWNSLSETKRGEASAMLQQTVETSQPTQEDSTPVNLDLSFVGGSGTTSVVNASATKEPFLDFSPIYNRGGCSFCPPLEIVDSDSDGLPNSFENSLADGFTPSYYISGGENAGTGFASFFNSVPQAVDQVFGSTPPISNFRVTPLGFFSRNDGIQYGLIQIDYLTLWNKDDGLVSGGFCIGNPFINPASFGNHALDNERSAILVAAPLSNSTYNLNIQDYKIYEVFTAAHEETFFDQSRYYNLSTPFPFDSHIKLGLSRSKHATYTFNPDGFPILPRYVIFDVYSRIYSLYYSGQIGYGTYLAYLFAADQTFFRCIVESFQNQGGTYANTRINIGELSLPSNGSNFIQDVELSNKLNRFFY